MLEVLASTGSPMLGDIVSVVILLGLGLALAYLVMNIVGSLIEIAMYGVACLIVVGLLFYSVDVLNVDGVIRVLKAVLDILLDLLVR